MLFSAEKNLTSSNCLSCGLYRTCVSPNMETTGQGKKRILIIGESPSKQEDYKVKSRKTIYGKREQGIHFLGEPGFLLKSALEESGIDLRKDCWSTNAIRCRPPKNRAPESNEIAACWENLDKTIRYLKPHKIFLLGMPALRSFFHGRIKQFGESALRWMYWQIPDRRYNCWVTAFYHPSYILRNEKNETLKMQWERGFQEAIKNKKPFPELDDFSPSEIDCIYEQSEIIKRLHNLRDIIAFDYETVPLHPYDGGKVLCVGVSNFHNYGFAFPIADDQRVIKAWKEVLKDNSIKKVAHNAAFENLWTEKFFKCQINGWHHDTMLAAHILDNRQEITGLKFQAAVRFGFDFTYGEEAKQYMKKGKLHLMPKNKLLSYCGTDAALTYKLFLEQQEQLTKTLNGHLRNGNSLFLQGSLALGQATKTGLLIRKKYYEKHSKKLTKKMVEIKNKLPENMNPNASRTVSTYLEKKQIVIPKTSLGEASITQAFLKKLKDPIAKDILEFRMIQKLKTTYVDFYLDCCYADGKIHPSFPLNLVKSYRSSSSFQNVPKRNQYMKQLARGGVIPGKGHVFILADYSQAEVKCSCVYHNDPAMIQYCSDPKKDMHRDTAQDLFFLEQSEVKKPWRQIAKNSFVFPQFYGSYFRLNANDIWEHVSEDKELKAHLKTKGIKNYFEFEEHVKEVESIFWNQRFPVYRQWRFDIVDEYLKNGYITTKTGFWFRYLNQRNTIINYQTQGTAFHWLLFSLTDFQYQMKKLGFKAKAVAEIHDEIMVRSPIEEVEDVCAVLEDIMVRKIETYWPWINTPLEVEFDVAEKSWHESMPLDEWKNR